MSRYALRTGEPLAISADAIRRDADGFFLVLGGEPPENETRGSVVIVKIRGALQQFKGSGGDSYESIDERVAQAIADGPSAVMLDISSPGGVVAGLNEMVYKLRRRSKAAGIPLVAYVNELAASAAYALCCACSEVLAPPSGIVGSVGVISTMISIAKRDEKEGIEFRIITSGSRKADGHLHMPITDAAEKAERDRNDEMAKQFFALASKARGIPPAKLASYQAAIYMNKRALATGLVDDIMRRDDVLYGLSTTELTPEGSAPNEGNVTDRRAEEKKHLTTEENARQRVLTLTSVSVPGEATMPVKLDALIKKMEASLSTETDPKKLRAIQAQLAAFQTTRAAMDDDDGDDKDDKDDDDDSDEDESKAKKAAEAAAKAKAKAESAKHRAKAAEHKAKAAEYEEAAKKCEEEAGGGEDDEEKHAEEEASTSLTPGAAAALASQGALAKSALDRLSKLEKAAEAREHAAMIDGALAARRITKPEAKTLRGKSAAFVRDFLEMRPHAIVNIDDSTLPVPSVNSKGDLVLPSDVQAQIDMAVQIASEGKSPEQKAKIRSDMETAQRARLNGSANGARY